MIPEVGVACQADKPPGRYGALATAAEGYGFDVVSVFADLLYQPPLPALLEMARATSRVRLGAACLNPYTQHPYEIAGGLAVLDAVSSGRAYLGLARGAWLDAIGIAPRRPLECLRDTAGIVRALLSGSADGYEGAVYRLAPGGALARAASVPAAAAAGRGAGAARGGAGRRDRRRDQGGRQRGPGAGAGDQGAGRGGLPGGGPVPRLTWRGAASPAVRPASLAGPVRVRFALQCG
jgi:5,10-methylenetetrahydromethanopterin reductase